MQSFELGLLLHRTSPPGSSWEATLLERMRSAVGRCFQPVKVLISEVCPRRTASAVIRLVMRWDLAILLKMVCEKQSLHQAVS